MDLLERDEFLHIDTANKPLNKTVVSNMNLNLVI